MGNFLDLARDMRSSGEELDVVLVELRGRGASIIESIKVVIEVEHVGLGEAKLMVDASSAWADMRTANRELRELAIRVMEDDET